MRWSQTKDCQAACAALRVSHGEYISAMKYILRAGPIRGAMAIKLLASGLRP